MTAPSDDIHIIRLAAAFYRFEGHRINDARVLFDLGPVQFWQRTNQLLDDPDVALAEPVIVARLRRERERRTAYKQAG